MWKIYRYTLIDLARNRFALGYGVLLMVMSTGLFMLDADADKALIGLTQLILALVPLLALVFTIIWFYNQYEFTVLLAVQPLPRSAITRAQLLAVGTAMVSAFLFGTGLPLLVFAPGATGGTLILTGTALTLVFCSLGLSIAVRQRDRAKAVGLGLGLWVLMALVYDALLLWLMFAFSDRPIEPLIVPLAALDPIDLSRILIMLKIDLAALLGASGAVYRDLFGTIGGMALAIALLGAWMVVPAWRAVRAFVRKDL